MRRSMFAAVLFGLVLGDSLFAAEAEEKVKKQMKRIAGEYTMVSGEDHGEPLSDETIQGASLVIKGDKHTVVIDGMTIEGTHTVDPSPMPKAIDSMQKDGPYKGETILGIYKFMKGEFTVCFAAPGKDRPKEFTTKSGTGVLLHVWKKKPKK